MTLMVNMVAQIFQLKNILLYLTLLKKLYLHLPSRLQNGDEK